jgi:hypothetical protein
MLEAVGRKGRSMLRLCCFVIVCVLAPLVVRGQPSVPADPFRSVEFLIGHWQGTTEGQPGNGTVVREYSRVLNSRFIRVRNHSTYPPQPANPKGEVHEDEGFISFDRARQKLILRQFHVEGFVNQYVEDDGSTAQKLVFTSEQIENIPTGFRARETYVVIGADEFEEVFELAEPGKQFEVYSRARLRRTR